MIPFDEEELAYIAALDPVADVELLRRELPSLRDSCLRTLHVSTMLLKVGHDYNVEPVLHLLVGLMRHSKLYLQVVHPLVVHFENAPAPRHTEGRFIHGLHCFATLYSC